MQRVFLILSLFIICSACKQNKKNTTVQKSAEELSVKAAEASRSLGNLVQTHHAGDFKAHSAVRFEVKYDSDKPDIQIFALTDLSKFKIQTDDGKILLFNGVDLYTNGDSETPKTKIEELLLPLKFFVLPYQMTDWDFEPMDIAADSLSGETFTHVRLKTTENKFWKSGQELGLYIAPITNFLTAVHLESNSSKQGQFIWYKNYFSIGPILVAKYWEFYPTSTENFANTKPIEKITLSKVQFFKPSENTFTLSSNLKKLK